MDALPDLPLFPLPDVVLFPGIALPMYVFEPRYRALLARVVASGEPFGIVRIAVPSSASDRPFHERVARVGTLAHVREVRPHGDGTSSIRVVGGERFLIEEFDLTQPYLSARAALSPLPHGPERAPELAGAVLANLMRLNPQQRSDLDGLRDADPLLVASYAATVLPLDPADREALLAAPDLDARLEGLLVRMPAEARQLN